MLRVKRKAPVLHWFCLRSNEKAMVLHWVCLGPSEKAMILQWFSLGPNEQSCGCTVVFPMVQRKSSGFTMVR